MSVNLTTPVSPPDIVDQAITHIEFWFPHGDDVNGDLKIDKGSIMMQFQVSNFDADGNVISTEYGTGAFADWPAQFVTEMKAVYQRIEGYAQSLGLIEPGTSEPLE